MSQDDKKNDDVTSFFVTPKRTSVKRLAERSKEDVLPDSPSSGRSVDDLVARPAHAPAPVVTAAVSTAPVDRVIDYSTRTKSYRTALILTLFLAVSVISLGFSGWKLYDRYGQSQEADWGDGNGTEQFVVSAADTGLGMDDGKRKKRRSSGKKSSAAGSSSDSGTVTIKMVGTHPFTTVKMTCKKSRFTSPEYSLKSGTVRIVDVPAQTCRAHFNGGPGARERVKGGERAISCEFKNDRTTCR